MECSVCLFSDNLEDMYQCEYCKKPFILIVSNILIKKISNYQLIIIQAGIVVNVYHIIVNFIKNPCQILI